MKNIHFITVIPQSQYSAKYYLNDSTEAHSKRLEDLKNFLIEIIEHPKYIKIIDDLIYSFQAFMVDVKNKTITELTTDLDKNKKELKESQKNFMPNFNKKAESKLDLFNNIGNKNIFTSILDKRK